LEGLLRLFKTKKRSDWVLVFLASYMLLHNYEMIMKAQVEIARWRQAQVRFTNMPLITGCHSGAKAILWHYHYFCKAQKPFLLDWGSEDNQDLDIFGHVEKEHMRPIVTMVSRQEETLTLASVGHDYEREFWFTGQLFDRNWQTRVTLEESPPA